MKLIITLRFFIILLSNRNSINLFLFKKDFYFNSFLSKFEYLNSHIFLIISESTKKFGFFNDKNSLICFGNCLKSFRRIYFVKNIILGIMQ